ncbi:MAG: extracellular solute-binding protein, partial [Oscillospiraceae bacterium]|nr:extracellular solute-binding protein [Oscillospiraceae bacterium]
MNRKKLTAIFALATSASMMMTACGTASDDGAAESASDTTGTTALTVEINTETLAAEQQEQVSEVADSLTGELENKTIKWMSFYDPWHPGTTGNTKPVSVELFESKYGGEIEYYATTWSTRFDDISTSILGGEGIDFIAESDLDSFPKGIESGMVVSYDEYVDWENPLWASVKELNDQFELGGSHYVIGTHASSGYVVYSNRATIEANGFDDPAELFANGEWTLDKFKDMLTEYVDEENEQFGLDGWFN